MAENSGISWTDHTFNAWIGCAEVSPGCDFCYARTTALRYGLVSGWGPGAERKPTSASYWRQPHKWNARAEKNKRPELVFCASMSDIADGEVPDKLRGSVLELIGSTPWLRWLLLTKRPTALLNYVKRKIAEAGRNDCIPPNIWWGYTAEDQQRFDERTPVMMELARRVARRSTETEQNYNPLVWLSAEPLLGPIKMGDYKYDIDWTIVGGESNSKRAMEKQWALDLLDETRSGGNRRFFKQTGDVLARELGLKQRKGDDPSEWPEEFRVQEFPPDARREKAA